MNPFATYRPVPLLADAGVPMIFVTMPTMVLALVPIIVVEALLIRRRVEYRMWPVFRASATANVASTVLGIPLTWGVLFLCELGIGLAASRVSAFQNWNTPLSRVVTTILSAPWIAPTEEIGSWAVPLAALVLLVPFFVVSVWSERLVMEYMLPVTTSDSPRDGEVSESKLRRAVRDANLVSYAGLFAFTCFWLVWGILHK